MKSDVTNKILPSWCSFDDDRCLEGIEITERKAEMEFTNKAPLPEDYNALRISSGMGNVKDLRKIEIAMSNSLFIVSVYDEKHLIALGRIIGDGGISYAVSDIMVDKKYQRKGIANEIMNKIDEWFNANVDDNSFIMLLANKPADLLYRKHRFQYLDIDNKVGMIRV